MVLLHEDIMVVSPESGQVTASSMKHMESIAKEFFAKLGLFAVSSLGKKDFENAKQLFLEACSLSHIRLVATPVIMESDRKQSSSTVVVGAVLTAACVELLECLIEKVASCPHPLVEYIELLKFEPAPSSTEGSPPQFTCQPDVRLQIKRTSRSSRSNRPRPTHTDISILLQHCTLEVDMTILDRISAVLNPQPLCTHESDQPGQFDLSGICQPLDQFPSEDIKTDLKITSPLVIIKLRFPIPDLRPLYDMDRPLWWKRNVRKDILFAHFEDATFLTSIDPVATDSSYELQSKSLTLLFQEAETNEQIAIGYAEGDNLIPSQGGNNLLRFKLKRQPPDPSMLEDCVPEKALAMSMMQSVYIETKDNEPSPFSSKRVVYESDTPHASSQCEGEELVIPGDREEMRKFIEQASRNTKIQVEISLPKVNVHLPSKHLFEVIYNRLNTDLSLWVPSPQMTFGNTATSPTSVFRPFFSMSKSGIQFESDSESDEEEDLYYSVGGEARMPQAKTIAGTSSGQSKVTITLKVGKGAVSMINMLKTTNKWNTHDHGHLVFQVEDVNLFTVSGFKGTPHHNYICAQINNFSLLHRSQLADPTYAFELKTFTAFNNIHLNEVIYKTEAGAMIHNGDAAVGIGSSRSADMLTVAVKSEVDECRVKMVRVACGIRGATLRHRVTHSPHSWLIQLLDFFDVMDYPVPGYQPSQVISELHQHLWDCAVDYRPVNLPIRCMLSFGNLSISSNIAASTTCSTLRFIAEDAFLFITDKMSPTVELRLDYVCVMDLGLFELSLRMSESPRVDLRASNNVLRIRTCSDSAKLLAQLIVYLASNGDLQDKEQVPPSEPTNVPEDNINVLSESTILHVNRLMEDAMIDDVAEKRKAKRGSSSKARGVEVFYFPDENVASSQLIKEADLSPAAFSDTDSDEFVMVEHEPGFGILGGRLLPEVRVLSSIPIVIKENHFSKPTSKTDFLKAPAHFPSPVCRYTLREMSLVWHMYGGLDFPTNPTPKKHVKLYTESESTPSSPAYKRHVNVGVNYSKTCPQEVVFDRQKSLKQRSQDESDNSKYKNRWWIRGGIGRQHDVLMELHLNKVRFQHEVYPANTTQASRQVLLIHELDIRDRLAVSKINKFLYQYTSEARPRQSHANMVVIKALHLRPDLHRPDQECCLRVSLLPIRLNIDQDSLFFLFTFANDIAGFYVKEENEVLVPASPKHRPPVMAVHGIRPIIKTPLPMPPQPQLLIMLNDPDNVSETRTAQSSIDDSTPRPPIYFRRFDFSPDVLIRLDYQGKHVDLKHGPLRGLLIGLAQLSCSELRLKRISHRHGLLGFEKLLAYVINEWLNDIKKNQLPSLLGGVGPMSSFIQLFLGIRDLICMPIEQYQRDGRIVRGLQRGANSFSTSTAMAALELTTRIVYAIQCVAETAFDMVSPGPSLRRRRKHKRGNKSRSRYTPPVDFREGVTNAVALVKEGIGETAHTLVQEALAEHEDKGAFGAVGGVLRQIPPTMVKPIILASEATSNLLGGVRSQLVPDSRKEATLKWRDEDNNS